jgi:hypothetical protein
MTQLNKQEKSTVSKKRVFFFIDIKLRGHRLLARRESAQLDHFCEAEAPEATQAAFV